MAYKAELNRDQSVEYREYDWGDWIAGTKEQLQALGLGTGKAYPGEAGCQKRKLTVHDSRGYSAEISCNDYKNGIFAARIFFPHWPQRPYPDFLPAFLGVEKREHHRFDEYIGSAEALAVAGLVHVEQLPGQPGMRKMRVTIFPDGSVPSGASSVNHPEARLSGAKHIERAGERGYRVRINVPEEEKIRRLTTEQAAVEAWEHEIRMMPRPPRLRDTIASVLSNTAIVSGNQPKSGHLRLVWSTA